MFNMLMKIPMYLISMFLTRLEGLSKSKLITYYPKSNLVVTFSLYLI